MTTFGRYEIIAELGRGGMAQVFHAHDPQFDREVAVKVLPREFLHDPQFRVRFQREARALAALQHRAIVPVHDLGEEDGQPFLVMGYMSGGSLADRLRKGPISLEETSEIISQLAPALDYAHQHGMIHRDIKPGNILFDGSGYAYLSDFGIVRLSEATTHLTGTGALGTPAYMAPELADKIEPTHLLDIYAMGVVVYEMLSGVLPYEASTPVGQMVAHVTKPIPDIREANPFLPSVIQDVIDTALAKNPDQRYPVAADLSAALQAVVDGQTRHTHAMGVPPELETQPIERAATGRVEAADTVDDAPIMTEQEDGRQPARRQRRGVPLAVIGALLGGLVLVVGVAAAMIIPRLGTSPPDETAAPSEEAVVLEETDTPDEPTPEVDEVTAAPIPETGDPALLLAEAGVASNAEWQDNDWWPYTQVFDGVEMALVPAGCFMMGSTSGDSDESPVHEVCFDAPFWVDVYEVTNAQVGESSPACAFYFSGADQPHACITSYAAIDYCVNRGARLPTEAEWEYAARGPDSLTYPWGDEFITSYLVENSSEPDVVGSRPEGISWVGALDMSGNVSEWVTDWYLANYYATLADGVINPQGPDEQSGISGTRAIRGGSWGDSTASAFRAAERNPQLARGNSYIIGFRCVRDYDG